MQGTLQIPASIVSNCIATHFFGWFMKKSTNFIGGHKNTFISVGWGKICAVSGKIVPHPQNYLNMNFFEMKKNLEKIALYV